MPAKPIPDNYSVVTPYLIVGGASAFIDFVKQAFGATEMERNVMPGGGIMHGRVKIGDSYIMLADPMGDWKAMPSGFYLYVEDSDAVYATALSAGATSVMPVSDQFYGDRLGRVKDPFGNLWWIATHKEDVPPEEMQRRAEAAMQNRPSPS